jgi:tRNA-dependent cyclodipeptide synthase
MSKRLKLCPVTGLKWRVARLSRRDWHADRSIASIDVSMHNPRCDGRYLDCQLHWAKPRFSAFEFSIGDTLQVHNYCSFGHPQHGVLSMADAHAVAGEEGRAWRERNEDRIRQALQQQPVEFIHWDAATRSPGYEETVARYKSLILGDDALPSLLCDEVLANAKRRTAATIGTDDPRLGQAADFVFHEIADYHLRSQDRSVFHIYPGDELRVMTALRRHAGTPDVMRTYDFVNLHIRWDVTHESRNG